MSARWNGWAVLLCLLNSAAIAQEAGVFVVVENSVEAELAVQVEDKVCGGTAFDGVVEASSIVTLALCADEHGLARVVVTNVTNGQASERSVASGGAVVVP